MHTEIHAHLFNDKLKLELGTMPNTLPAILTADASAAAASAAEVLVACSDLGEAGVIWRLALDSQRGRGQFKNYY